MHNTSPINPHLMAQASFAPAPDAWPRPGPRQFQRSSRWSRRGRIRGPGGRSSGVPTTKHGKNVGKTWENGRTTGGKWEENGKMADWECEMLIESDIVLYSWGRLERYEFLAINGETMKLCANQLEKSMFWHTISDSPY